MSGISVIDADGKIQEFAEAITWHVDDRGQLHLKSESGPVASFAKDRWQGAGTSEANSLGLNAQAAAIEAHTAELVQIHAVLRDVLVAVTK
ncbi:MAG: hypothetical protein JWP74_1765 [Marmoricola sp.]|nr:hypothetical protein [Marmoricola sp.]